MVEGIGTTVCNGLDQKTTSKRRAVTVCSCSFPASTKGGKKPLDYSAPSHSTFQLFSFSKHNSAFFLGVRIEVKFKIRMQIKAHCYNCSWG